MTNRPDIPEEAIDDALSVKTATTDSMRVRLGNGRYAALVESLLQAAAPAIRKQGAEEAEKRMHSKLRKLALKYGEPTRYELLEVARSLAGTDVDDDSSGEGE